MMKWKQFLPQIWPFVHYRTIFGNERLPSDGKSRYVENTEAGQRWIEMLKWCPSCHHKPIRLAEGPSGGMSTNVFCMDCGQGYNITPICEVADLIRKDERYIQKEMENL